MADREWLEEMMYRSLWDTDPDDETFASFRAAIAVIPYAVKRRFGYLTTANEEFADAEADAERSRLNDYTNWC